MGGDKKQDKNVINQKPNEDKKSSTHLFSSLPPNFISSLADEVVKRLPHIPPVSMQRRNKKKKEKIKKVENAYFLDTSAIIDGRIFDVIHLGLFNGVFVVTESILLELKHIADSQDVVKRERGRKGLDFLEKLKKARGVKFIFLSDVEVKKKDGRPTEVDELLIKTSKHHKGKIITCDYNLSKKAGIEGAYSVNVNALAQCLKVQAVPGEALHVKLLHQGKDLTQGVGYLDDGTMIVVEHASIDVGRTVDVVVSRVIQTAAGRILFSKKIS